MMLYYYIFNRFHVSILKLFVSCYFYLYYIAKGSRTASVAAFAVINIRMRPDFRGNLRGPSGNRLDIKFENIFFIKFSVDGICTASVTTRDPGNDNKKHLNRIWILAQLVLFNCGVCGPQQNILPKNDPSDHLIANGAKWSQPRKRPGNMQSHMVRAFGGNLCPPQPAP